MYAVHDATCSRKLQATQACMCDKISTNLHTQPRHAHALTTSMVTLTTFKVILIDIGISTTVHAFYHYSKDENNLSFWGAASSKMVTPLCGKRSNTTHFAIKSKHQTHLGGVLCK